MKVNSVPEGFDKVLQFNVYMKNGEQRDRRTDLLYTVKDEYEQSRPVRDSRDRGTVDPRTYRESSRDRQTDELTPDEVGDIRSFLNRVRSEPGEEDTRRSRDPQFANQVEETMFKPRDRDRTNEFGERTQEKTPQAPAGIKKARDSPETEGYFLRDDQEGPLQRPIEPSAESRSRLEYDQIDRMNREPQGQSDKRDDGRYLEIFVRPKRGQEKLVYREDGEPAEVIHRFTPKKNYDRYNQEPEERIDTRVYPEDRDYRKEYRNPELRVPESSHKKYAPRYEEDERPYPGSATKQRTAPQPGYDQDYPPVENNRRPSQYNQERPRTEESEVYPMHRVDPEEAYGKQSRMSGIKFYPSQEDDQPKASYQPRNKPLYPAEEFSRPERSSRGRYPDDLVEDKRESYYEPMEDQERRKYQQRQKELIQALYDEKNALKELVDRLCNRLDNDEPNSKPQYQVEVRPREEYVDVPRRKSKSPTPRPEWQDGPYKNTPERDDMLSKQRRKSPFDVDRNRGKTEWEINEPYLKQYEKLGRTPERKRRSEQYDEPSPTYNERHRTPNRYDRTAPPKIQTYSPVRESPKAGDEFCGLCDVYLDKDSYKRDRAALTSPKRPEPRHQSQYRDSKGQSEPATYFVQGRIIGKLDRPAYIRDLFQPSHLA